MQLQKVINNECNDWDYFLQMVTFAYRTSVQSSLLKSPFEMMYGVKAALPVQLDVPVTLDSVGNEPVARCAEVVMKCREKGLMNLQKAQQKQRIQYDLKHKGPLYKVGDKVKQVMYCSVLYRKCRVSKCRC